MVFFSVIVPVFNRENLVESTLDSIFNQEYSDLEIIVVDDGSTDGTIEILEKYGYREASRRHCITILHQENKGPGAARNLGIARAKGQYITFLDSDDLWFPWSLNTIKNAIKQHNYPDFIAGNAIRFAQESEVKSVQCNCLSSECFADYYTSSYKPFWLLNGAVAIKTDILQKVGGFANQWINGEDSDLWLKLGTAAKFVFVQSPSLLAYRHHVNSAVANNTKTYEGAWHLINQEKQGLYPGGKGRRLERLEILMRHIRPVSLAYLRDKKIKDAWKMYRATFYWNLSLKRFAYLIAFLFILSKSFVFKKIYFILNCKTNFLSRSHILK